VKDSKILILGITFKENCPDIRNTKVVDIYNTLTEYTHNITVFDPWADSAQVEREYGIKVVNELPAECFDAVILAVAHKAFAELDIRTLLNGNAVVYDVKGVLNREVVDGRL
jgi:UDP-N-acetyl-D-galactosamine dehydrogenase